VRSVVDVVCLFLRIYVTDAAGRVVLDSGLPSAVGEDYSQWRDVALTLRGDYGARSTRYSADDRSTILVVAAPVLKDGRRLGVVSVAKPVASVQRFIDRAERRVFWAGAALLAASLVVGVAVTLWLVASVRRLRRYAQQAQAGQALAPPEVPGELGELAHAMDDMRRRLEDQTARLQALVERVLALSQLEAQVGLGERQRLMLADWTEAQLRRQEPRILVTDAAGQVVLDSGRPSAVGQDYSRWRDVALTLRGEYGARASPLVSQQDRSTVLFVAAPVLRDGRTVGVVSVSKPVASVQRFIDRAETRVFWAGALLLTVSLATGVAVTLWLVASVRRLRRYAQQAQAGQAIAPPAMPGELGDLAHAMDDMRRRLEGREQLEHDVRALTHELKSPLAALRASGELLQDDLPAADRQRFAAQVLDQTARLQTLVERVLALSQLEAQVGLGERQRIPLADWAVGDRVAERHHRRGGRRGTAVGVERHDVERGDDERGRHRRRPRGRRRAGVAPGGRAHFAFAALATSFTTRARRSAGSTTTKAFRSFAT